MRFVINGQSREFPELAEGSHLEDLIQCLGLKGDRVAVEYNGAIVGRAHWGQTVLANEDKLEIVHFVGGGADTFLRRSHR